MFRNSKLEVTVYKVHDYEKEGVGFDLGVDVLNTAKWVSYSLSFAVETPIVNYKPRLAAVLQNEPCRRAPARGQVVSLDDTLPL